MRRAVGVSVGLMVGVLVAACSGSNGATGAKGDTGSMGPAGATGPAGAGATDKPSVSAVTPTSAFLGRTVDLTISGNETAWSASTKVVFADPKITVNTVTVASPTGLLVNVTIGQDATVGPVDLGVSSPGSTLVYKSAFSIASAVTATTDPAAGVPQGGIANVHVAMLDTSTPLDPDTATVTVSSNDATAAAGTPTDFGLDATVYADVLATPGTFDVTLTSGTPTVTSTASQALKIVARAPAMLTSSAAVTGTIATEIDTALYQFTPASASQEFIQFRLPPLDASDLQGTSVTIIPKSGKYADALAAVGEQYGQGVTSNDPFYVVVGDGSGFFGANPTPVSLDLVAFESPCTALDETSETVQSNNDSTDSAQAVTTLPALVTGTLGYGSVDGTVDLDTYAVTVTGAPKTIHVATGGDPANDTVLQIVDSTQTAVATSDDLDYQENLTFTATADGTYYVVVAASQSGAFSDSDSTYQLFIDVK